MNNKEFIKNRLLKDYEESVVENILTGYKNKYTTLRVNTLKSNLEEVKEILFKNNIDYKSVSWYKDALIIENAKEKDIRALSIYEEGKIYLQNLSSFSPFLANPS